MHWSTIASGLLSVAAVSESRSWQHVGREAPRMAPANNFASHYLASRQSTEPKFLNDNTTSMRHHAFVIDTLLITRTGYAVNGTGIPDVDFDVGESYAGLLSITDDLNAAEKLYFWFFPSTNQAADKEILLWLNGGVSRLVKQPSQRY